MCSVRHQVFVVHLLPNSQNIPPEVSVQGGSDLLGTGSAWQTHGSPGKAASLLKDDTPTPDPSAAQ